MRRRTILTAAGATVLVGAAGYGLRAHAAGQYAEAAAAHRLPMDLGATGPDRLAELVRMASLAPNSHNTQGWTFTEMSNGVVLSVDHARRTPVVDPDDHHLYVSLGAAAETLIIAATAYGLTATPDVTADGTVTLTFANGAEPSPLLPAISRRQTHRGLYDGQALTGADRTVLLDADPGLRLIEDVPTRTALRDLTVAAYGTQMADGAYRAELKSWLRFSHGAAMQTRDGLFSGCSGSPALPQILGEKLFDVLVKAKEQSATIGRQMNSAPAFALMVTDPDTSAGRIDTGRRLQRIGLAAVVQGLAVAHVNPALESPNDRAEVALICGVASGRPSLLLRLGRGASSMPFSLRRPPAQTLLTQR
jgi:hypothetical protein